jgi:hypothetical protein
MLHPTRLLRKELIQTKIKVSMNFKIQVIIVLIKGVMDLLINFIFARFAGLIRLSTLCKLNFKKILFSVSLKFYFLNFILFKLLFRLTKRIADRILSTTI